MDVYNKMMGIILFLVGIVGIGLLGLLVDIRITKIAFLFAMIGLILVTFYLSWFVFTGQKL